MCTPLGYNIKSSRTLFRVVNILKHLVSDTDKLWETVLGISEVSENISQNGFFISNRSFRRITGELGLRMKMRAPEYLSKDFWATQSKFLRDKQLYVIRTGRGRFALVNSKIFPRPYLQLSTSNYTELECSAPSRFRCLKEAFDEHSQENACIEQLGFLGIFEQIISELFSTSKYCIGPRGNRGSKFDVYLENIKQEKTRLFSYSGQEELDYTLWVGDNILLFEAKQTNSPSGYLDLGWHKLAFPANRFRAYPQLNIFPAYLVRRLKEVFIFVFPKFLFHETGIILNDSRLMMPRKTYRIDLSNQTKLTTG